MKKERVISDLPVSTLLPIDGNIPYLVIPEDVAFEINEKIQKEEIKKPQKSK